MSRVGFEPTNPRDHGLNVTRLTSFATDSCCRKEKIKYYKYMFIEKKSFIF